MTQLLVIRGLPGSGKSTFAQAIASLTGWKHFEAYMYFINAKGEYEFNSAQIMAAHQWCRFNTKMCLATGWNVVVANTFTRIKEIDPYRAMADDLGVQFNVIKMVGDYGSIHGVPADALKRMKDRWED